MITEVNIRHEIDDDGFDTWTVAVIGKGIDDERWGLARMVSATVLSFRRDLAHLTKIKAACTVAMQAFDQRDHPRAHEAVQALRELIA